MYVAMLLVLFYQVRLNSFIYVPAFIYVSLFARLLIYAYFPDKKSMEIQYFICFHMVRSPITQ